MAVREVEVVVVRHGETDSNRTHTIQGHLDTPLSTVGLQQAESVARYLSQLDFAAAISSDLARALQTCRAIVTANTSLTGREVTLWPVLRERCFGQLEGKEATCMQEQVKGLNKDQILDWGPPGGETGRQFRDRVREFLAELCKKIDTMSPDDTPRLLLTSHGGFIKELNMVLVKDGGNIIPWVVVGGGMTVTTRTSLDHTGLLSLS